MKAIETAYHGPTNTRGARYSASAEGGNRVTVAAKYDLDTYENLLQATE